jgi:hypothetical protein
MFLERKKNSAYFFLEKLHVKIKKSPCGFFSSHQYAAKKTFSHKCVHCSIFFFSAMLPVPPDILPTPVMAPSAMVAPPQVAPPPNKSTAPY